MLVGHKIAEAVIENGELKYIDRKLPQKKMKVHIIYDDVEEMPQIIEISKIVEETSGLYKDIDVTAESKKLRKEWERHVHN
jgi:hypothetical protein